MKLAPSFSYTGSVMEGRLDTSDSMDDITREHYDNGG